MQVNLSGKQIAIGESLTLYAKTRLQEVTQKYFANAPGAHIYFAKNNRDFACEIILQEGTGRHLVMKSNCSCDDIYSAFDKALGKLEKQMRRYRSKLNNHHRGVKISQIAPALATKYVIETSKPDEGDEIDTDNPAIIAEKPTQILNLTVGQAVMKMDLENLPALMFENAGSGRINIVYYRKDGNISWVDSKQD